MADPAVDSDFAEGVSTKRDLLDIRYRAGSDADLEWVRIFWNGVHRERWSPAVSPPSDRIESSPIANRVEIAMSEY